jgi:hypothetical protein
MKKDKQKRFMEGVSVSPHHTSHHVNKIGHVVSHQRIHYGSGYMSDYAQSIKDARKRMSRNNKTDAKIGGSVNTNHSQTTRVF